MKNKPKPRRGPKRKPRPPTPAQRAMTEYLTRLNNEWNLLDGQAQNQWSLAVKILSKRSNPEKGIRAVIVVSKGKKTLYGAFRETNLLAHSVGQDVIIKTPALNITRPVSVISMEACLAYEKDKPAEDLKIILSWKNSNLFQPHHFVRIWAHSEQKIFYNQIAGIAPSPDCALAISGFRAAKGKILPVSKLMNSSILFQVDTVDKNTGWASSISPTLRLKLSLS